MLHETEPADQRDAWERTAALLTRLGHDVTERDPAYGVAQLELLPDGLPLSVQRVGRLGAEDVLYSLAAQIESAAPWVDHRPPIS